MNKLILVAFLSACCLAKASDISFHDLVSSLDTTPENKQKLIQSYEGSVIDSLVRGRLEKAKGYLEYFSETEILQIYHSEDRVMRKHRKFWFDSPERWNSRDSITDKDFIFRIFHRLASGLEEAEKDDLSFDEEGRLVEHSYSYTREDPRIKIMGFVDGISLSLSLGERYTILELNSHKNTSLTMSFDSPPNVDELIKEISNKAVQATSANTAVARP